MRIASTLGLIPISLVSLLACDPGYDFELEVRVSDAVAADYGEQARGLLVIESDAGEQAAYWIVCGAESAPIVVQEVGGGGLGCPQRIEVQAFIAPLDAADMRACGELAEPDWSVDIGAIDPAWPQASATLRNPCDNAGKQLALALE
jgi:hypothetical protein